MSIESFDRSGGVPGAAPWESDWVEGEQQHLDRPRPHVPTQREIDLANRWRSLSPTLKEYLTVQSALKVRTLSVGLRAELIDRRDTALSFITTIEPLQVELAAYVRFRDRRPHEH